MFQITRRDKNFSIEYKFHLYIFQNNYRYDFERSLNNRFIITKLIIRSREVDNVFQCLCIDPNDEEIFYALMAESLYYYRVISKEELYEYLRN